MFLPQTPWEHGGLEGDQRGTGGEHPHSPLDVLCSSLFLFEEKQRPRGHMERLGCDCGCGWLRTYSLSAEDRAGMEPFLQLVQQMACRLQAIATCLNLPAVLAWGNTDQYADPWEPEENTRCVRTMPESDPRCSDSVFSFFTRLPRASQSPVPS